MNFINFELQNFEKMTQITIQLKDKEEENLIENLLKKMKIHFTKNNELEDEFELTDEMKKLLDERLKEDKSEAVDAWESLRKIRAKYGV